MDLDQQLGARVDEIGEQEPDLELGGVHGGAHDDLLGAGEAAAGEGVVAEDAPGPQATDGDGAVAQSLQAALGELLLGAGAGGERAEQAEQRQPPHRVQRSAMASPAGR
ncbi:MAG: hypothetical protein R3F43_19835 [bacterium]